MGRDERGHLKNETKEEKCEHLEEFEHGNDIGRNGELHFLALGINSVYAIHMESNFIRSQGVGYYKLVL